MTHEPRAEERMTSDFLTLPNGLNLAEAQAQLQEAGLLVGVVVDADGTPVSMIGPDGPGPLLAAGRDTPLRAILDTPTVMARINAGAPGVVIVDDGQPIGVITEAILRDYLMNQYLVHTEGLGDESLHGGFTQPHLVITCAHCGARNELTELVEGHTMCVNGHVLAVEWS